MRYLSVCSGIEAATCAWHPLGWEAAAFSEIEKFPSAVLAHRYPHTKNLGDMTKYKEWNIGNIDLLVGGTPCQSFSVAGLRKGLDDPRGNLALVYLGIAERFHPRWVLWENVPGVLSSYTGPKPPSSLEEGQEWEAEETSDFECFTTALAQLGYGFAYRILDAQYFGVPQRRRRVFVVGYLGDWRRAAAVLFERHSLQGHTPPSREAGKETPSFAPGSFGGYNKNLGTLRGSGGDLGGGSENLVACADVSPSRGRESYSPTKSASGQMVDFSIVMAHGQANAEIVKDGDPSLTCNHETPIAAYSMITANTGSNGLGVSEELAPTVDGSGPAAVAFEPGITKRLGKSPTEELVPTLRASMGDNQTAVAFSQNVRNELREHNVAAALQTGGGKPGQGYPAIRQGLQVRRLTPIECERLQGFPDNYTRIPWRGKEGKDCPVGHRYKALGNSMAVPVMKWVGERIQAVDTI